MRDGRIRLLAPAAARAIESPDRDPRDDLDTTAAVVDLRLGDDGRWRGAAGVDWTVPDQAADGIWEIESRADGVLILRSGERADGGERGCWSTGRRTVADVVTVRASGDDWTASMCGTRYPVVEFAGRRELTDAWQRAMLERLTAGVDVDPGECALRSVACDRDALIARCGERWVLPGGRERVFEGPEPPPAACGRGFLRDTGVEVPDPCSVPPTVGCRPPAFPSEGRTPVPEPARPYVRWCSEDPSWAGPGLHPPYRAGRPHGAALACWRRALERDAGACAEVWAVIARPLAPGARHRIGKLATPGGDDELADCMARALEEWEPPGPPDGGRIVIRGVLRAPGPAVPRSAQP